MVFLLKFVSNWLSLLTRLVYNCFYYLERISIFLLSLSISASMTKYHRTSSLQTTDTYSSQFWRTEVQDAMMVRC